MSDVAGGSPLIGATLAGKYRIIRMIGEGAMGAVFEAEMVESGRHVAVKTLSPAARQALGDEALARFLREAQVSASLKSDNVVEVIDGSQDDGAGVSYLVMELLQGEDLEKLVERTGALEPEVAVRIIRQAARGLAAAHAQGIVHRDLKPSNIFLHRRGDEVVVKVCDFGVAKDFKQEQKALTVTGSVLGSPLYMAPEQLLNARKVDWRADIWGLAMTAYDALAGTPALVHIENLAMLVVAIVRQDIPALAQNAPWLEPGLCEAIHRALQREPDARYQSMDALAEALAPYSGGTDALSLSMLSPIDAGRKSQVKASAPPPVKPASRPPAQPSAPSPDRTPQKYVAHTIAKRYQLLKVVADAPDGWVYEAKTTSGRPCWVRVVPRHLLQGAGGAKQIVARAREAREIRHDHLIKILDCGDDPIVGVPFVVMEPLGGMTLAQRLRERGPLEAKAASKLFMQVAGALGAIHEAGKIHGEVRPEAIFLVDRGSGEEAVLTGFGEANLSVDEPGPMAPAGTEPVPPKARYMSPELARASKEPDPRIDVWGLSLSLYESVAGRHPFGGVAVLGDLILAICMQEVPPLSTFAPQAPAPLVELLRQGLQRNREKRPGSTDELIKQLAAIAGEPVPPKPKPEVEASGEPAAERPAAPIAQPPARPMWVWAVLALAVLAVLGIGMKMMAGR